MQNKQTVNKKQQVQTEKATVKVANFEQEICDKINALAKTNKLISLQKVTGYTALKYANKTVCELHFKKKSIAHLTIAKTMQVFELLKAKNLVTRIVSASYGWRLDTECLITKELMQHFDAILKAIIDEAVAQQNLKQQKTDKKVKKAEKVA